MCLLNICSSYLPENVSSPLTSQTPAPFSLLSSRCHKSQNYLNAYGSLMLMGPLYIHNWICFFFLLIYLMVVWLLNQSESRKIERKCFFSSKRCKKVFFLVLPFLINVSNIYSTVSTPFFLHKQYILVVKKITTGWCIFLLQYLCIYQILNYYLELKGILQT